MCNNAHMQWDDLRYVLCLCTQGTLTNAAGELGVSHTTVARRVAALEEELGSRLFDKTPQGYVPTRAGEEILSVARRVEEQMNTLDRQLLGRDTRLSGKLRVTTIDAVATRHAREIGAFTKRYPAIELALTVDNRLRSLTRREADVAIRFTNNPAEHLVGRKLGRAEFAAYASEELIAAQDDPTEIGAYPWLGWDEAQSATLTERFLSKHVASKHRVYRVDTGLSMIAAVTAGIGVSFLACMWGDSIEGLRRLRDVEPGFGMDMWLLTHPDLRHTARVRAFMDHFSEAMLPHVDLMAGARPAKPAIVPAQT
jgi:DNA-binding transcriptional LysR family regulator